MPQKQSGRIVEFDALRGVASLLVMAHHGILAFDQSYWTNGRQFRLTPLAALEVGRPMVVFFFVLSGVVLTRSLIHSQRALTLAGFASYAVQRVIRLCVPAAAATLLSFGL